MVKRDPQMEPQKMLNLRFEETEKRKKERERIRERKKRQRVAK